MNPPIDDIKKIMKIDTLCFMCIFISGAVVRFYHLETPSMWWDEVLVAIISKYPVSYIFDWASTVEVHAPYFHLFTKIMSQIGSSDFTLKFIPTFLGTLSIFYVYKLTSENFNTSIALISSALFALNPIHIIMSRQLRPYTIVVFLFLISSIHLLRYLKSNKLNDLMVVVVCNLVSVAFHYNTLLIIATQGLFVIENYFVYNDKNFKKIILFSLGALISVAPVLYFFVSTIFTSNMGIVNSDRTYLQCLLLALKFYSQLFFLFDLSDPFKRTELVLSLLLFAVGIAFMARRNKFFFLYTMTTLVVPLSVLTLGKNSFNASRYVLFIMPMFCISVGCFFANLPKAKLLTPPIVIVYTLSILYSLLSSNNAQYFGPQAHSIFGPAGNSKEVAKQLTQQIKNNEITYFANKNLDNTLSDEKNAVNWYYSQYVNTNYLNAPQVENTENLTLNIIARGFPTDTDLKKISFSDPIQTVNLSKDLILSKFSINRNPSTDINSIPFAFDMNRTIKLLANSLSINSLTPTSLLKSAIAPTMNNTDCILSQKINSTNQNITDCNITLDIFYTISNKASAYSCNLNFANVKKEETVYSYKSEYSNIHNQRRLQIVAPRKVIPESIHVNHVLNCSFDKPLYAGDNLSNIQLNRVVIQAAKTQHLSKDQTFFFDFLTYDLLRENSYKDMSIKGFSEIEYDPANDTYFRWTEGPVLTIIYEAESPLPALLSFKYLNLFPQNEVSIFINGKLLRTSFDSLLNNNIAFDELAGRNKIEFFTNKYNHKTGEPTFAEKDPRELGIYFQELTINRNVGSKEYDY